MLTPECPPDPENVPALPQVSRETTTISAKFMGRSQPLLVGYQDEEACDEPFVLLGTTKYLPLGCHTASTVYIDL